MDVRKFASNVPWPENALPFETFALLIAIECKLLFYNHGAFFWTRETITGFTLASLGSNS